MTTPSPESRQLRNALRSLACAPQAQRRYVQLGQLRPALADLERLGADPAAADLDGDAAALVVELRAAVGETLAADPGLLDRAEDGADSREYLFGHALEDPAWNELRRLARRAYSAAVGGPETAAARTAAMVGRLPQPAGR